MMNSIGHLAVTRKTLAVFAALLFSVSAQQVALAQSAGSIRGIVTDPSASLVPGATVIATGSGLSRAAKSDGQGRYALANLPAGDYNVRADAPGFVTFLLPKLTVASGQANSFDIALQIAAETQQISVNDQGAGQVSTDASSNVGALVLTNENLDALADDPDDLQADLQALAGPSSGPNGAQFFVDGFSGGQLPAKSSIREIRINSNPFSSEYDRPGFGRIEILTKPGTDTLHGTAFFNYGNRVFDTRNPLLTTSPPDYSSKMVNANVGGAINKKSSFFVDFNRRDITENALIQARTIDSSFNETASNSAYLTPQVLTQISPRIDYQINATNTLVMRYSHQASSNLSGVGGFNLPSQQTNLSNKTHNAQITETAIIGTRAVDETRFQFRDMHNNQTGLGVAAPITNVSSSFIDGGSPLNADFTHTKAFELQNILTMTEGVHTIKAGFRVRHETLSSQSTSNFNGTYTFFAPNTAKGVPQCLAGFSDPTSLDLYRQTQLLLSQHVPIATIIQQGCGPTQFSQNGGIPLESVNQFDIGLFAQDDWRIRPNLTVNLGLRYETQTNIDDRKDVSPRIGFAWAPTFKGKPSKTVIRGGYGLFYDRLETTTTLQTLRFNGVSQKNYLVTADPANPASLAALASYPGLPSTALLTSTNQAIYKVASDFQAPYMSQLAIEVDRQLPGRTSLSVNYVNSRTIHVLRPRNINAPLPGTFAAGAPVRPYSGQGDLYLYESSGIYKQSQLITNVNSRINSRLSLQGFYAFGDAHSNSDGLPMDQYNTALDYARANTDIRHRGLVAGNIGLPLKVSISPFVTMNSGAPFNITTGNQYNGDGIFNARPAFATSATLPANLVVTPWGSFDKNPANGATLIPRNLGTGPAQFSVNMRLSRSWGFGEKGGRPAGNAGGGFPGGGGGFPGGGGGGGFPGGGGGGNFAGFGGGGSAGKKYNVTLTLMARNAFNHPNLGQPNGNLTSPFFGQSTSLAGGFGNFQGGGGGQGGGQGGAGAAGNRKVEIQVRFQF
jgi:hypothetical protein